MTYIPLTVSFHIFWAQSDIMGVVESEINDVGHHWSRFKLQSNFRKQWFNLAGNQQVTHKPVPGVQMWQGLENPTCTLTPMYSTCNPHGFETPWQSLVGIYCNKFWYSLWKYHAWTMPYHAPGGANPSLGSVLCCLFSICPKQQPPTFLQRAVNSLKFWFQWYQFHVNLSKTRREMNILHVFLNIKTAELFLTQWVLLLKIWSWYC